MISFTSCRVSTRILSVLSAAVIAAGSTFAYADTAPATAPAATQGAATQPTSMPALGPVMATVNGEDISRVEFDAVNTEMHGVDLLRLLESCKLASKACIDAGIPVGEAEDKAEMDRMLDGMAQMGLSTKEQQKAGLAQLMISRGVSQIEFALTLHRAACLRALAKGKVTVNDEDIQTAFDAKYGERVRFRDVQVRSVSDGAEILRLIKKENRSILELVSERNLPMYSYDWNKKLTVPEKQIKDTAFQLEEREVSSVITIEKTDAAGNPSQSFHLLYIDKKIPADTTAKLDDAMKAKLRAAVTEQKEAQWGQQQMDRLVQNAHVDIKDPYLQVAFQELMQRQQFMNGAASRPATQPATAPAATAPAK